MVKQKKGVPAVVQELLREIQELTSRQFVYEDPWHGYVPMGDTLGEYQIGPPVPFADLHWRDQADVVREFISWDHYAKQGVDRHDQDAIQENVRSGKPPDRWLDGTSIVGEATMRKQQQSDAFDRIAADPGKAWDETFGIMVAWANAAECNKVEFLASYAAIYDVSFERFEKAVQHGLGRQDVNGGDEWTLHGQFESSRIMLGKDERAEESPWPVPERAEPPSLAEQFQELLNQPVASSRAGAEQGLESVKNPDRDQHKDRDIESSAMEKKTYQPVALAPEQQPMAEKWQYRIEPYRRIPGEDGWSPAKESEAEAWFGFRDRGDDHRCFGVFRTRDGAERAMEALKKEEQVSEINRIFDSSAWSRSQAEPQSQQEEIKQTPGIKF